jgi:hypothetical protein
MTRSLVLVRCLTAVLLVCQVGCAGSSSSGGGKDEDEVRQTFVSLQEAIKEKDTDKLWSLLDADSAADAERQAEAVRNACAKADEAGRKELEKAMGLPGKELETVRGPGYLKTKRFLGKYDEVPTAKFDKVVVQGEKATVNFTEADGDKEKLSFVREKGRWKVSLPIPKAVQP